MARYKHTDAEYGQGQFLTVNLQEQLLPGTYEYMLDDIIEHTIDAGIFDAKYKNDETGASAINPKALLKLVFYGYSKDIKSSRRLWDLSLNNIIAKALTRDTPMHWTSIADFISGNVEEVKGMFVKVLAYCNELGLVGGETFAIDGLRLPSNASLALTGTEEELKKKVEVYKRMAEKHIERHRRKDERGEVDEECKERYEERRKELKRQVEKISGFLEGMEKKRGKRGQEIRSNVTDNESALIMSGGSYIQGYIGIAVADEKNQVIVSAEAAGSANESEHFQDMLDKTLDNLRSVTEGESDETKKTILADNNYFGEDNLRAAEERGIEAIIPDKEYKRRLGNKGEKERYGREDFKYREEENCYECPGGKKLEYKGESKVRGEATKEYAASVIDCRACPFQGKCIKRKDGKGELKKGRRLIIRRSNEEGALCGEMKAKMSTEAYQERYAYRIGIIEPVFSDIGYCKGLDRFTLRGREKVNAQWQLYCMVHNLGKALKAYNKMRRYA